MSLALWRDAVSLSERRRRIALNSIAGVASKAVSFAATFALFPVLLRTLGKEEFAVWLAVTSVVQVFAWADFGLGNGIVTALARIPSNDAAAMRSTISSAYRLVLGVSGIFAVLLALGLYLNVMPSVLGLGRRGPYSSLAAIGYSAFVMWLPSSLIGRIQVGLRKGWISNTAQASAALCSAILTVVAALSGAGLAALIAIACFTPVAINIINSIVFFTQFPELRPRLVRFPAKYRELLRLGFLFFCLQLGTVVLTGIDSVVALGQSGPNAAIDYSAVSRIFGAISAIAAIVVSPLWPEYGKAHAAGDIQWVRRTYVKSLASVTATAACIAFAVIAFSPLLFSVWPGGGVRPSYGLLLLASMWLLIDCAGQCTAMLLNGLTVIRCQVVVTLCFVCICLPLKLFLARHYGAAGIYVSTISAYVIAIAVPYGFILPRMLRTEAGRK
jgi:O-antigen/teichoic acid export membrane protein